MRILFAAEVKNPDRSKDSRLMQMVKALQHPENQVAIVGHIPQGLSGSLGISDFSEIQEIDWDVVIVQNLNNLLSMSEVIKKKPMVFISNGTGKHEQCFNLPNLYKVIATEKEILPAAWGIPEEHIEHLTIPGHKPSSLPRNQERDDTRPCKLVYFANDADENLKTSREVVKALNIIPYASLTVVTSAENMLLLKDQANSNIVFSDETNNITELFTDHDAVLASGEVAVSAVMDRKPVVVVGEHGLGGVVCSDNLDDFIQTEFRGRIGGAYQEAIPISLLDYEIRYALGIESWEDEQLISDAKYDSLANSYQNNWEHVFFDTICSAAKLYQSVTDEETVLTLTPIISRSIMLAKGDNSQTLIINKATGKLIGSVDKEEAPVVESCNGKATIGEIIHAHPEFSAEDITDFVLQLWENKAVVILPLY